MDYPVSYTPRSVGKAVNEQALRELISTKGIGAVVDHITTLARPFGDIEHWRFSRYPKEHVIRFFVELHDPTRHQALAQLMGATLVGREICVEIPVAHERGPKSLL